MFARLNIFCSYSGTTIFWTFFGLQGTAWVIESMALGEQATTRQRHSGPTELLVDVSIREVSLPVANRFTCVLDAGPCDL